MKVGRNDLCPCGSGKKYKKCCLDKYVLTNSDLYQHLKDEIQLLVSLCKSYDEGAKNAAKILALRIRILIHDTGTQKSLLGQLGRKNILFYDTASDASHDPNTKVIGPFHGFIGNRMTINPGGTSSLEWVPWLDNTPPYYRIKKVPLQNWTNKVVIVDGKNNKFTREDLILCVCDKDGGAHIDPEIDKDYADLSRHNSMGWKLMRNGAGIDEEGPHLACMRQIAHEVVNTLKDEFPECFAGSVIYNPTFG
jgi:hypothetical protein